MLVNKKRIVKFTKDSFKETVLKKQKRKQKKLTTDQKKKKQQTNKTKSTSELNFSHRSRDNA